MFTRKKVAAAGATAALAGALVVGGLAGPLAPVFAATGAVDSGIESVRQTPPNPAPKPAPKPGQGPGRGQQLTPEQRQQMQQQRQQAQQEYLNRVAANLGVSPQQLQDALKKTRVEQINQAVSEGKLSQDQANQMIQRINSGQGPIGFGPNVGGPGHGPKPGDRQAMRGGMMGAAQALGLTPEQLRQELQGGKTLAQVAEQRNVSRDELKARLQAQQKQRLDQAVQQGRMTAEQASQVQARFAASLDRMLDASPGQHPAPAGAPRQQ